MVYTPDLALAKAALTATLLRADPDALHKGDVTCFLELLDDTLDRCSRPNVQNCKNWIFTHVIPSSRRVGTLGRYLVALSESMDVDFDRPSVKRRRLHALFIANDVIHHTVKRQRGEELARSWDSHLPAMVATASTFERCPKHLNKVRDLISLWEERKYLPAGLITRLRDSLTRASDQNSGTRIHLSTEALKLAKEAPYVMPSSHGDSSTAWNHLPPSSWLVQLSDSRGPMRRDHLRPAQLTPRLTQEHFVNRVKSTLSGVEILFQEASAQKGTNVEYNLLGGVQKQGDSTEDVTSIDTYWGWSRVMCRSTRERRQRAVSKSPPPQRPRSRSASRLSSMNRSGRSPNRFKRSSRSRSRDRSRSPRRHYRSGGTDHGDPYRERQRSSSYSRSRSPAPPRGRSDRRSIPSSRDSSRSGSELRHRRPPPSPASYNDSGRRGTPQGPDARHSHGFPAVPHQGPGGFPVPPPPPVGYQGIFLPPPPPQGWNHPHQPGFVPTPAMGGGWVGGPVPPPPMPSPYDAQQHGGRGSGWSGGGGRGYRGRGRGGSGRGGGGRGGYGYGSHSYSGHGYGSQGYGGHGDCESR